MGMSFKAALLAFVLGMSAASMAAGVSQFHAVKVGKDRWSKWVHRIVQAPTNVPVYPHTGKFRAPE